MFIFQPHQMLQKNLLLSLMEKTRDVSTMSQTTETKKSKMTVKRDTYPWKEGHQDVLAEFLLDHALFKDKRKNTTRIGT